jgi:hypothetical protein
MATQMQQPQASRNGKFVPTQGIAEIIALAAVPGEMAPSEFGPSEVRYRLTDGRTWYVPQVIADEVNIRIAARQQFEVLRFGRNKTDLRLTPLAPFEPPAEVTPEVGRKLAAALVATAAPVRPTAPPAQPPAPPPTPVASVTTSKLMSCFMASIDAVAEAQQYANRKGLGVTFTSEDIRACALSCYINACREGR